MFLLKMYLLQNLFSSTLHTMNYYFSIILDLHFPSICYRKLLTPPVVPANDDTSVGIAANPSLDDLAEIMPEVAHSMKEILDYKGDVCEDLLLSFEGIFLRILNLNFIKNGGQNSSGF